MWRTVIIVILSAALGSLSVTCIGTLMVDGTGAMEPVWFIIRVSMGTMIFTLPGALMLNGLRAILMEQNIQGWPATTTLLLVGAAAGGLILCFFLPFLLAMPVGGLYGFATAAMFVSLQKVVRDRLPSLQ